MSIDPLLEIGSQQQLLLLISLTLVGRCLYCGTCRERLLVATAHRQRRKRPSFVSLGGKPERVVTGVPLIDRVDPTKDLRYAQGTGSTLDSK